MVVPIVLIVIAAGGVFQYQFQKYIVRQAPCPQELQLLGIISRQPGMQIASSNLWQIPGLDREVHKPALERLIARRYLDLSFHFRSEGIEIYNLTNEGTRHYYSRRPIGGIS